MIDVKQAVKIAKAYVLELYSDEQMTDVLLEAVELSEDDKIWLVTMGFNARHTSQPGGILAIADQGTHVRKYKVVSVNSETGDATALKIRELA